MNLEKIMSFKKFIVIGSTENPEKYAWKIKERLIEKGYQVYCVNKNNNINNANGEYDIIDLCINPMLGIKILREYKNLHSIKGVLIQPGVESEEIREYLKEQEIDFLEGCALVGLSLFA